MQINLNRITSNHLYTEGTLTINGALFTNTVEHTFSMLPIGTYKVELLKLTKSRRKIVITSTDAKHYTLRTKHLSLIAAGNSWKDSLKDHAIIIGQPLIPGAVKCSQAAYTHLFDRLEKCKTPVTLSIHDTNCKENQPLSHWL